MNELRRQKRRNVRDEVIVFLALTIFMTWLLFDQSLIPYMKQKSMAQVDWDAGLDEVSVSDLNLELVGRYNFLNDDGEEESGYFAQLPNGAVVRINVDFDDDIAQSFEKLWNAREAYDKGEFSKEEYDSYQFIYTGIINAKDQIVPVKTIKACEGFQKLTKEQQANFKDYWIKAQTFQSQRNEMLIFIFFVLLGIGLILGLWIPGCSLWLDKQIAAYLKTQDNRMYAREKISHFFNTAQIEEGFWMDEQFIGAIHEGHVVFGESKKVVAVFAIPYEEQIAGNPVVNISRFMTRKIAPVNMGMLFVDGRTEDFTLQKGPKSAQKVLEFIENHYPWVITDWLYEYKHMQMDELLTVKYNENMNSGTTNNE